MPGGLASSIATLSSWIRDWLTVGAHADSHMTIALALTEEVLGTARDMRADIEPRLRSRPFVTRWKDHLETGRRRRASYMRIVD